MAIKKESLNNFLPDGFETLNQEGYKENFSADKISTGYEKDVPDIVSGPNLNNLIDVIGKNTNTLNSYVEYLNSLSVNKTPIVDSNNQLNSTQIGLKVYSATETYLLNDLVTTIQDGKVHFYRSLVANNTGHDLTDEQYWEEVKLGGGSGLELCDIGMALYVDETKGLRRYLNGQIVDINTNTQAFLDRLKEITTLHPSLLCTEEEWQSAKTMSAFGQVGKFVFNYNGADIVSVRLPRVVNVQGLFDLQNLGMTVRESLPNINGYTRRGIKSSSTNVPNIEWNGAIGYQTISSGSYGGSTTKYGIAALYFNASHSSSTYKDNAPVQQEAIQYPYFIQIATGSETENNIINEIELNNPYSLFDSKYSDHELNNLSWLKSNGQWNAKAVYPTAYDKLLKVYNGTETVEGLSVKLSIETYTDYDFVLNTAEETFRLPLKTKLASGKAVVGNGMTLGLTDGTMNASPIFNTNTRLSVFTGSYGSSVGTTYAGSSPSTEKSVGVTTDPAKSGIELSDSNLYLYYYVGETVQNANLIDAGRIGEQLANKIGRQDCKAYITETYVNGTSGYRLYSDKWCEQWGYKTGGSNTVTLLKEYKDTNYGVLAYVNIKTTGEAYNFCWSGTKTVSTFTIGGNAGTLDDAWIIQTAGTIYWKTEGYIA